MEPNKTKKCQAQKVDDAMICKRCRYIWALDIEQPRCKSTMTRERHSKLPVVIFGLKLD